MGEWHWYTVDVLGKQFKTMAPYEEWDDVVKHLGIPRERLTRGANQMLPQLTKDYLVEAQKPL